MSLLKKIALNICFFYWEIILQDFFIFLVILQKPWPNEEKEQFSPVSTLDCPFDDEDEVSSPFQHRLSHVEGRNHYSVESLFVHTCSVILDLLFAQ